MITKKLSLWMIAVSLFFAHPIFSASVQIVEDQISIPILTPDFAERKTCKLRLSNGLEAILISDPRVTQSGAALSVEVGSWNDPKEYPGMAHFLEHMLFMGTKAFPDEAEYLKYIEEHGGNRNAFTASDRTVYGFSIDHDAFEGAVNRFSHFFVDPLFSRSSLDKEMQAVDQEYAINVENDSSRISMILQETGNPAHPNAQFSIGNATTLSGIPAEALFDWYQKHYSASRMHLMMLSRENIETMQKMAEEYFSAVPVSSYEVPLIKEPLFSDQQKGGFLYIKPLTDTSILSLNWEVPEEFTADRLTQVDELIAYVLGSEEKNGLAERLKAEHLAENVMSRSSNMGNKQGCLSIDVYLTEKGVLERDKVIERCYQMIARLKSEGIPEPIFQEMKQLALTGYQYKSREDVFQTVIAYANAMIDEPLTTFPEHTAVPSKYDPVKTQDLIERLTPNSCITVIVANPDLTQVETSQKEKWCQAEYTLQSVPSEMLAKWAQEEPVDELQLPAFNLYIPQDFTLVNNENPTHIPELLVDNPFCTLYHLIDSHYQVPETSIRFSIHSPLLNGSAKSHVLLSLYHSALNESLMPILEAARRAGLEIQMGMEEMKFVIAISGFSDKVMPLTEKVLGQLKELKLKKDRFLQFKQSLKASLENCAKELPFTQAVWLASTTLTNNSPSFKEQLQALEGIQYEQLADFTKGLFEPCHVDALVYGNTSQEGAKALYAKLEEALGVPDLETAVMAPQRKLRILANKEDPYRVEERTSMQGSSLLLYIQQGPLTQQKLVCQYMIADMLKTSFFDALRTKQQTGYIANAGSNEVAEQLMMCFGVQSNSHTPDELLPRFEAFIDNFLTHYEQEVSKELFESLRAALINKLSKPSDNLQTTAYALFDLAFNRKGNFAWNDQLVEIAQAITYEEVKAFAQATLSHKNGKRLVVAVHGTAPEKNTPAEG